MQITAAVSSTALNDAERSGFRPGIRIASVDFVRGVAMVLMALDHVRVYSGVPAGGPTFGVFFTRWITHFVAPTFVFLAGTSAYLYGRKLQNQDKTALSKFLFTRGLWLVFLEMTVLRLAWTFNLDFAHYLLAGVIWMLGWCMVLMAALVRLPIAFNGIAGIAIIALHNLTDVFRGPIVHYFGAVEPNWILKFLYFDSAVQLGPSGPPILILYVIVPWIGLMMAGYAFGVVLERPQEERRRFSLKLGASLTVLFILLRAIDVYGDPRPWRTRPAPAATNQSSSANSAKAASTPRPAPPAAPAILRFLNTTKYPASLAFLLMTIGPMFLLLSLAENIRGPWATVIATFGRVPMFYYLLHIPLIHGVACLVSLLREGYVNPWLFANHPLAAPYPPPYMWSLWLLYSVYFVCLVILYFPCKWYAGVRATRKSAWLSYL
jgi:uncharacterized membrane protein